MDLKSLILERRNIKDKSINAYLIILKKLNDDRDIDSLDYLNDTENIIKKINEKKLTTQRNYVSAVLTALSCRKDIDDNDETMLIYKDHLKNLNDKYDEFIESHQKTQSQVDNWCSLTELDNIRKNYKKRIRNNEYAKKETLTHEEKINLTYYVIVSLYTLLPPVRVDYAPMKIITDINDDDNETNYLYIKSRNNKQFILNEYKTSKKYGKKIIDIPPELNSVINLYLKFHSSNNSFLFNSKGNYMTAKELTLLIPKAFSIYTFKNITLNLLRHIYISENIQLKSPEQLKKEKDIADVMGHSLAIQQTYYKN